MLSLSPLSSLGHVAMVANSCFSQYKILNIIYIIFLIFFTGDVRLTDGGAPNQGRIEFYSNDTWWTLCSSYFHGDAHSTVCRKLGYNMATGHYRDGEFGAGNLSILHTSFYCDYGAYSLLNCTQGPWYGECHRGVVGVVCDEMVFAGN